MIEIDGKSHLIKEAKEYDEGRTAEFERFGIKEIRFTIHQVEYEMEQVLEKIKEVLINLPDPK